MASKEFFLFLYSIFSSIFVRQIFLLALHLGIEWRAALGIAFIILPTRKLNHLYDLGAFMWVCMLGAWQGILYKHHPLEIGRLASALGNNMYVTDRAVLNYSVFFAAGFRRMRRFGSGFMALTFIVSIILEAGCPHS